MNYPDQLDLFSASAIEGKGAVDEKVIQEGIIGRNHSSYVVYVDESGDHSLEKIDDLDWPGFRGHPRMGSITEVIHGNATFQRAVQA